MKAIRDIAMCLRSGLLTIAWLLLPSSAIAQASSVIPDDACADRSGIFRPVPTGGSQAAAAVTAATRELIAARFPELDRVQVRVRTFKSRSDYFRTRFSVSRFLLLRRMRYFVEVNPRLLRLDSPSRGVCAILGHELAHVTAMSHGNRLHLLGLARLLASSYTTRFERRADLEAIVRGFGPGLKDYRVWVYQHVPVSALMRKKRDYFSPEEIDALIERLRAQPALLDVWRKHVPLNEAQIVAAH